MQPVALKSFQPNLLFWNLEWYLSNATSVLWWLGVDRTAGAQQSHCVTPQSQMDRGDDIMWVEIRTGRSLGSSQWNFHGLQGHSCFTMVCTTGYRLAANAVPASVAHPPLLYRPWCLAGLFPSVSHILSFLSSHFFFCIIIFFLFFNMLPQRYYHCCWSACP